MSRSKLKIELTADEQALVDAIRMPMEIGVPTEERITVHESSKQTQRRPFIPRARWLRAHESQDERLSWWKYPGQGEVLLFDPHGLRVQEMRAYLEQIVRFAQKKVIYILHGGDGTNPLSLETQRFFGGKFAVVNFNRGLSKIDLRRF